MEEFKKELAQQQANLKHFESNAVSNAHLSKRLHLAGEQTKAKLSDLNVKIQQSISAQLATAPSSSSSEAPSARPKEPLGSNIVCWHGQTHW